MSHNTFGHLFRVTTFGESHGPALGCVVDGCPPRIPLTAADIQPYLDKRRPGQSRFTTQRREPDTVSILSGFFPDESGRRGHHRHADRADDRECRPALEGLLRDQGQLPAGPCRLHLRRQIRPARLSRRRPASARETAARVAAGAIARKIVPGMVVRGALVQIGPHKIDRARWDWDAGRRKPVLLPRRRQR